KSGSAPQTDQWPRSPARGCGRMSSRSATATHPAPCISTPSTGRPQSRASAPGHPDQQGAVTAAQSKTRRRTPQGDAELMAEEQVLGFKPARGLEEVNDEHCERIKEREHRSRSCDDSTRRCDSQAGWDFRKGQDENLKLRSSLRGRIVSTAVGR